MNREQFLAIFDDAEIGGELLQDPGDNALKGLLLITKYLPESGIEGAGYDVIFSADLTDLLDAGITADDAEILHRLNWFVDDDADCLACYV